MKNKFIKIVLGLLIFTLLALINISLIFGYEINYEILKDEINLFLFFVIFTIFPTVFSFSRVDSSAHTTNQNTIYSDIHILLTALIPNVFIYNIYFSNFKFTHLLFSISIILYILNYVVLSMKLNSKKIPKLDKMKN